MNEEKNTCKHTSVRMLAECKCGRTLVLCSYCYEVLDEKEWNETLWKFHQIEKELET